MAKRTSQSRKARRRLRKQDKEVYEALNVLGGANSEQELMLQSYEIVLRRMVEGRIAQ